MEAAGQVASIDFEATEPVVPQIAEVESAIGGLDALAILRFAIEKLFPGRIALTSSFGADSAVLLHMVAQVGRDTPVLFLDTGKLFPETVAYRDELVSKLGLTDVRIVRPSGARLGEEDPSGYLWTVDPDRCCEVRKVEPLTKVLNSFDAWITGRKRFQGDARHAISILEIADGKVKVNPLAKWQAHEIETYLTKHELPRHPLVARGYASIGCATCTSPIKPGESQRAGRWRHKGKTECGIHNSPQAKRIETAATTRELAG